MAKRETNKERRARQDLQRAIYEMAIGITGSIYTRRYLSSLPDRERQLHERAKEILDSELGHTTRLDGEWVETESIKNIAKALRMAADILEEKPPDGRSLSEHDERIMEAFSEASARVRRDYPHRIIYEGATHLLSTADPTFSEFLEVYREQNPRVKVEPRTLRRSLQRLGFPPRPDKRGRPKGK